MDKIRSAPKTPHTALLGSVIPGTRLRCLARKCGDNRQIRRLLSLAAVYDGMNRTEAAKVGGMDRQTLLDWVLRFNEQRPVSTPD